MPPVSVTEIIFTLTKLGREKTKENEKSVQNREKEMQRGKKTEGEKK